MNFNLNCPLALGHVPLVTCHLDSFSVSMMGDPIVKLMTQSILCKITGKRTSNNLQESKC